MLHKNNKFPYLIFFYITVRLIILYVSFLIDYLDHVLYDAKVPHLKYIKFAPIFYSK